MTAYQEADFEYLLDVEGIAGFSLSGGTLTVYCCDDCESQAVAAVQEPMDVETECIGKTLDQGDYVDPLPETVTEPMERPGRHRPVPGGVSEIVHDSTAATAGFYPATVVDTDAAPWSDEVSEGDVVRLSNHHVYAQWNEYDQDIIQPGPYDGGSHPADKTGVCRGYVTLEDGVTVDAAARDSVVGEESQPFELGERFGNRVYRGEYDDLIGKTMTKTGRTTEVTEGVLKDTGATFKVNYGSEVGVITVRENLVTENMGGPGDSGSPMFWKQTGEAVGKLYAGSPSLTLFSTAQNIEKELGVQIYKGSGNLPTAKLEITLEEENGGGGGGGGSDHPGRIYVTANDDDDRRVANVTITLMQNGETVAEGQTNASGEWSTQVLVGDYTITGEKDGFESDKATIDRGDFEVKR